jgi:ligand-binding SRPBCC domain-containing protein
VEVTDLVDYKLPFGILGKFAHWLFVDKQLKEIFEYRQQKLVELLGEYK